jgi:hypothetical protein
LKIDRNRAQEIRAAAREEFSRISSPETVQKIQQLERSAVDLWNASQGNSQSGYPNQSYPVNASFPANSYPTTYPQANSSYDQRDVSKQLPLPTSSVARSTSTNAGWPNAANANPHPNPTNYYQQPLPQPTNYPSNSPQPYYQQPTYQQPTYQQPAYQQPAYQQSQPTYYQPPPTNYYQQPLTQQPTTGRSSRY